MTGPAPRRPRAFPLGAAVAVIAAGLVWRLAPLGLPTFALKYGGSSLWGAMVYFVVAGIAPRGRAPSVAATAGGIALATELLRLYHQPGLDAFRATMAGALLLGRIFSPWDLVAYAVGIGVAAVLDRRMRCRVGG